MSDLQERLEEKQREKEWATTWEPARGEMLVGTFEKMDSGTTEYGESRVAHIRDESEELWGVWLFHTVLQDQWDEADPERGDEVGILYMGKRSGSTHDYHAYDVEVERKPADRPSEEPDRQTAPSHEESTLEDPNGGLPY